LTHGARATTARARCDGVHAERLRSSYSNWLSGVAAECDAFVTATLSQALPNVGGGLTALTREEIARTLRILRDRVTKLLLGRGRYRRGERVTFLPFIEGGDRGTRLHAHICMTIPPGLDRITFQAALRRAARNLEWVRSEIDFQFATTSGQANTARMVLYSLKEGADAFVPEAAHF